MGALRKMKAVRKKLGLKKFRRTPAMEKAFNHAKERAKKAGYQIKQLQKRRNSPYARVLHKSEIISKIREKKFAKVVKGLRKGKKREKKGKKKIKKKLKKAEKKAMAKLVKQEKKAERKLATAAAKAAKDNVKQSTLDRLTSHERKLRARLNKYKKYLKKMRKKERKAKGKIAKAK